MIAKRRMLATNDGLLIVIASAVIVVSFLPLAPPRREVRLRDASGSMRTYSLLLDDPMLARLRDKQLSRKARDPSSVAMAAVRWQAEVASFYADQTRPAEIAQVAFRDQPDTEWNLVPLRMQHENWVRVRDEAAAEIERWETRDDGLQALESPAPIELGALIPAHRAANDYLIGLGVGLGVALLFAVWSLMAPTLYLSTLKTGGHDIDSDVSAEQAGNAMFDFTFAVPQHWVRVHQSPSVWLRRAAEVALVITAVVMLIV